jgi:D-sedoheptulose 7-phosphate isomerase
MDQSVIKRIDKFKKCYPQLKYSFEQIENSIEIIINCYHSGRKLLVAGNGGSSADSAHICGELLKGFMKKRKVAIDFSKYGELGYILNEKLQESLPAIDLSAMQSIITATINDNGADLIFAQQIIGLGVKEDVFLGISTSGNSRNVVCAGIVAKELGLKTVALTGASDSKMSELFDITIRVPSQSTPEIQEMHLPIYHAICAAVEEEFWKQ